MCESKWEQAARWVSKSFRGKVVPKLTRKILYRVKIVQINISETK